MTIRKISTQPRIQNEPANPPIQNAVAGLALARWISKTSVSALGCRPATARPSPSCRLADAHRAAPSHPPRGRRQAAGRPPPSCRAAPRRPAAAQNLMNMQSALYPSCPLIFGHLRRDNFAPLHVNGSRAIMIIVTTISIIITCAMLFMVSSRYGCAGLLMVHTCPGTEGSVFSV